MTSKNGGPGIRAVIANCSIGMNFSWQRKTPGSLGEGLFEKRNQKKMINYFEEWWNFFKDLVVLEDPKNTAHHAWLAGREALRQELREE